MAYNEDLAEKVRQILFSKHIEFNEKKMMGGLCFMVDEKMLCGISGDKLMARIHPDLYEWALQQENCYVMDFTKRPMRGYVYIVNEGVQKNKELNQWIQLCLDFNPLAKASKKK